MAKILKSFLTRNHRTIYSSTEKYRNNTESYDFNLKCISQHLYKIKETEDCYQKVSFKIKNFCIILHLSMLDILEHRNHG